MTSLTLNRLAACIGAACGLSLAAMAQQAQDNDPNFPIVTDRPTYSDGTTIVPVGHPQIEGGVTVATAQGTTATTYGEVIYRQALSDDFELRLVNLTFQTVSGHGAYASGLVDPTVGFKWKFQDGVYTGKSRRPDLAVEALTTVPVGTSVFRNKTYQPSLRLLAQYNTDQNTQLFANLIVGSYGADSTIYTQWAVSEGVNYQLTPAFGLFGEIYTLFPEVQEGPSASYADFGFTYLLNKRTQFDFRVGTGFDEARDGTFIGAGLSYRF